MTAHEIKSRFTVADLVSPAALLSALSVVLWTILCFLAFEMRTELREMREEFYLQGTAAERRTQLIIEHERRLGKLEATDARREADIQAFYRTYGAALDWAARRMQDGG